MGVCRFCRQAAIVKDAVGPICPDCVEEGYAEMADKPDTSTMSELPETTWDIHEFKIWKGLDKENPRWASLGFACSTWADADSMMQYIEGNKPSAILRVVPHTRAALAAMEGK